MRLDNAQPRTVACASTIEPSEIAILEVIGIEAQLLSGKLDADKKKAAIEAVRAGKHVELSVQAITFRQRDGSPNKNFLRLKTEKLGEIAASFVGKPFLLNHNKWDQEARMGTIIASELVELAHGWAGFRQTIRVVKPHAVISVLDGTIDAYSIGWDPAGKILCTAHQTDVRGKGRCGCWPGDKVEIDGKNVVSEYEWQATEGLETSAVNTPAVTGTKNEEVRTALAAELSISPPTSFDDPPQKEATMKNVNAILGLAADAPEENAVRLITELRNGKIGAEQERDTARAELATAKTKITTLEQGVLGVQVEALIESAYKEGKLRMGRDDDGKAVPSTKEARLRRIAKEDGIAGLRAELKDMEVVVPINQRQGGEDPPKTPATSNDAALASTANQLGLEVKDLAGFYNEER